jgi:hypothetical protein
MSSMRVTLLIMLLVLGAGSALAQRPGPQFRRPLACEPVEPRTKLEAIEWQYQKVLVKGFTQVATFGARGVEIRIDAVELKESGSGTRAIGLAIALRDPGENGRENRSLVDYDEIDRLLQAIDTVSRVNESVTKLASFEARYRTFGDLEINVFRQSRSGTAASLTVGICDRVVAQMTLDELDRFKAHIVEAKTRLDEIK